MKSVPSLTCLRIFYDDFKTFCSGYLCPFWVGFCHISHLFCPVRFRSWADIIKSQNEKKNALCVCVRGSTFILNGEDTPTQNKWETNTYPLAHIPMQMELSELLHFACVQHWFVCACAYVCGWVSICLRESQNPESNPRHQPAPKHLKPNMLSVLVVVFVCIGESSSCSSFLLASTHNMFRL